MFKQIIPHLSQIQMGEIEDKDSPVANKEEIEAFM